MGVGRGAGKLQTDVVRATLAGPHRSTALLCTAPTDLLPRNDMGATSEVASLTSCHSHPFESSRVFLDLPCYWPKPFMAYASKVNNDHMSILSSEP